MGIQSPVLIFVQSCTEVRMGPGAHARRGAARSGRTAKTGEGALAGGAARRSSSRDKAAAILLRQASVRSGADEWAIHEESITGTSCGATRSMTIIEPMPQEEHLGGDASCSGAGASL
jgi:hypothetical protein